MFSTICHWVKSTTATLLIQPWPAPFKDAKVSDKRLGRARRQDHIITYCSDLEAFRLLGIHLICLNQYVPEIAPRRFGAEDVQVRS